MAVPALAQLAWYQLRYDGDIQRYFQQLDNLLRHYPIDPQTLQLLAAQPFGLPAVTEIQHLQDKRGVQGLTTVELKQTLESIAANAARRAPEGHIHRPQQKP